MKKRFGEHVRIARGFFGCSSLWRGDGHYLYVKGAGFLLPFSEEYCRFEMRKIQSIGATRTARGSVTSLVCGVVALFAGLLAAAILTGVDGSPSDTVLFFLSGMLGMAAMVCLAVVSINIVLGPTCVFRIETAVRSERIRPLCRWREANAQLIAMRDEIELAQRGGQGAAAAATLVPPAANDPAAGSDAAEPPQIPPQA